MRSCRLSASCSQVLTICCALAPSDYAWRHPALHYIGDAWCLCIYYLEGILYTNHSFMPVQSAFHIAERLFAISGDLWCVLLIRSLWHQSLSWCLRIFRAILVLREFYIGTTSFCQCIWLSWNASRLSANSISLWIVWLCAYVCIASLVFELLLIASAFYCVLKCVMFVCQISQFTDCVALGMCVPIDPIFHYVLGVEGSVKLSLLNRNWWSFWSVWCLFARFHSFVVCLAPSIMSVMTVSFYVSYAGKWCVYIFC